MTTLTANIHREDGSYWAEVPDCPGVFATGENLDELFESLREGLALVVGSVSSVENVTVNSAVISISS